MMDGLGGHGWGMGWWWIFGLVVLVAVIWFIVKSVNRNGGSRQNPGKSALEILKERYAKGEIDKQEFEERKGDLR